MIAIIRTTVFLFIACILSLASCGTSGKKEHSKQKKYTSSGNIIEKSAIDHKSNVAASLTIATWNIQNLGGTKNDQELLQIAKIIKNFDVVAIQEVVGKDPKGVQAVAKIVDNLNRMGSKWDYSISDRTKSPSANMSERYAFIWKTSILRLINKPYLDKVLEDICFREPYIAKFKTQKTGDSFFVINYHSRVHSQKPEEEIKYFKNYPERLKSDNILIAGDFNLNETHMVWEDLYTMGFKSSIQGSPTTLKRKCKNGNYLSHAIDNIYFNAKQFKLINSGRVNFVNDCENLANARLISDHLPVFIALNF